MHKESTKSTKAYQITMLKLVECKTLEDLATCKTMINDYRRMFCCCKETRERVVSLRGAYYIRMKDIIK